MFHLKRKFNLILPAGQSAFFWGARQTGKSTYLHEYYPQATYYDLLQSELYLRFLKEPQLLKHELLAQATNSPQQNIETNSALVIIDEIQKLPSLLNEVHWLIENTNYSFILCGSSARQLKRIGVNLLGGRAWKYQLFPLVYPEIPDFDLVQAFNRGLLPSHYANPFAKKSLQAYIELYLQEEIKAEGLARNLPGFARFLESLSFSNGQLLNYANIARDCGIDAKTVREYYQILVDTMLGSYLMPYAKKQKRDLISATAKFYLFDVGIANYLAKRQIQVLKGAEAGASLEHYIYLELLACQAYLEQDWQIYFWRTKSGLEVDFIISKPLLAIEVKITADPSISDLKGLRAFGQEHLLKQNCI